MLVLSRKKSEQIRIGDDIVVTVINTGRKKVTIGVDAPQTVRVFRVEITEPDFRPERPLTTVYSQRTDRQQEGTRACHNRLGN